jgi:hypothetical protein
MRYERQEGKIKKHESNPGFVRAIQVVVVPCQRMGRQGRLLPSDCQQSTYAYVAAGEICMTMEPEGRNTVDEMSDG